MRTAAATITLVIALLTSGAIPTTPHQEPDYCQGNCHESKCEYFNGYPTRQRHSETEIEMLAKTIWGEARGCSEEEQKLVAWCIFQRVDDNYFPDTIAKVITQAGQFVGYDPSHPIDPELYELAKQEIAAWERGGQPPTHPEYAPSERYLYFHGNGKANYFREVFR